MALIEQIESELVSAQKNKDENVVSTLRMLKSALTNLKIATQKELTDEDVLVQIQKEIKSRSDAVALYEKGDRPELVEKEKTEIEILQKYLPEQLSLEEIREKVNAQIAKTGASTITDMGKVMGPVMTELKGKADGGLVAKITKEELSK